MDFIKNWDTFIKDCDKREKLIESERKKYKYSESFEQFMELNEVNDETITEDMMDWYSYHICDKSGWFNPYTNFRLKYNVNDYVNEMLKKTSIELLVKTLNRSLPCDRNNFVTNKSGKDDDHVNTLWITPDIYDKDKIFEICDRMMWVFTSVEINKKGDFGNPFEYEPYVNTNVCSFPVIRIRVEPVKTKNITDFVKNNCRGKIYHLCHKYDVGFIMKSGLRVKGEKNDYRYINNRLFFVCGETKDDIIKNLEIVGETIKIRKDKDLFDEYSLLEIDVNGYNIDFYQDGMYEDDIKYIGYTYNYFPPKRLKEIKINEL